MRKILLISDGVHDKQLIEKLILLASCKGFKLETLNNYDISKHETDSVHVELEKLNKVLEKFASMKPVIKPEQLTTLCRTTKYKSKGKGERKRASRERRNNWRT